jgi:hypothetical protein
MGKPTDMQIDSACLCPEFELTKRDISSYPRGLTLSSRLEQRQVVDVSRCLFEHLKMLANKDGESLISTLETHK